jgi:hypothetical protein
MLLETVPSWLHFKGTTHNTHATVPLLRDTLGAHHPNHSSTTTSRIHWLQLYTQVRCTHTRMTRMLLKSLQQQPGSTFQHLLHSVSGQHLEAHQRMLQQQPGTMFQHLLHSVSGQHLEARQRMLQQQLVWEPRFKPFPITQVCICIDRCLQWLDAIYSVNR